MKIIEVQFDGHVKIPGGQRLTNVLRVKGETSLGPDVIVEALTEDEVGVFATKVIEKDGMRVRYRKRFPWVSITEVAYEPEPLEEKKRP